jgi:hypothetical protein
MSENMANEKYGITQEELKRGQHNLFSSMEPLRLKVMSGKEKNKVIILMTLIGCFEKGRKYTESEVNGVLKPIFDDFVMLRRSLVDFHFLERTSDGKAYWVREDI